MSTKEQLTRRQFFKRGLGEAAESVKDLAKETFERIVPGIHLRPPGAKPEPEFVTTCARCGNCASKCQYGVIETLPASEGISTGTPVMIFTKEYCRMCTDLPCVSGCESGALSIESEICIGLAVVDKSRCWSATGQVCDYCEQECNKSKKAIQIAKDGVPTVDQAKCNGCGRCEYICPATNQSAIVVRPIRR